MLAPFGHGLPPARSSGRDCRQLVARHAIAAVNWMELAGGAGFYRAAGLERRFRDIQAARCHPLQSGPQAEYAGAMALGLPVDRIF